MALDTSRLRNPVIKDFADKHLDRVARFYALGAPVVADDDRITVSVDMKVGSYTLAAQPDVARNITVTTTAVGTADTQGTITITGTNINGKAITEVITPVAGTTVAGLKAFKTVTSAVGAGWVIDAVEGTKDTIKIGVGTVIGLPIVIQTGDCLLSVLGVAYVVPTVVVNALVENCTLDSSSGTYNGSKALYAVIVE